ncbi:MAG: glycosyl hydrolase family 17 protein [Bacteroidia bacterium]|nr:glycosyl hydrolase family 17 protein [Bacteroidia bacterium]
MDITAAEILGNLDYMAFSYGGYREDSRELVPTIEDLKEDMKILAAMGVKLLRTYNTQQFKHASNLLEAISQLKDEDPDFEMYVMVGAWIDCEGAWTATVNHEAESLENNTVEIAAAAEMARKYPDIVKIIAVGNEAMVHWAASYFVRPKVILKWVNHLKGLREEGKIPAGVWITSSDNFASWGGGSTDYHNDDLEELIKAVDYVSLHTYPFHDSHYNPAYWAIPEGEQDLEKMDQIEAAMLRAKAYAISQYQAAADYMKSLGIEKDIHIGETGWASVCNSFYGNEGSRAADEYKEKLYYDHMRDWTNAAGISCFYFEAFDEQWKDQANPLGSENHFGLINLQGEAKYPLWKMVDAGIFEGLTRNGSPITKTYGGDEGQLLENVFSPHVKTE